MDVIPHYKMTVVKIFISTLLVVWCVYSTPTTVAQRKKIDNLKDKDVASLWAKEVKSLSYKKIGTDFPLLKVLDISNILAFNDTAKNETPGFFSTYIGALGENFERIDFHIYSAKKVTNQDYNLKLLIKKGKAIDTLQGRLKLIEAFEDPELFSSENEQTIIFLDSFNFASIDQEHRLTIKGISSITFCEQGKIAENFWMEDGTLLQYLRTFVGYSFDAKRNIKQKCVFALRPAGLYTYLPFCDNLYYIDEESYSPDYYLIKDKYRKYGWQDYDYTNPKKNEWWKK